ncbi:lysoplasmalogenase family protein [Phenylobacterium sp.]|uniref:lysoplasmalogenase family protein n=1 Tax=Phenylobacterium sp. TaxID=1871053 RepID=UPI0035B005AB
MTQSGALGRGALFLSVLAGVSYVASWNLGLAPALEIAWKGAGVALLAVYAGLRARTLDGWLIALVMALGALGDVLLDAAGLVVGALAFLAGHLVAIGLYLRNRRPRLTLTQKALAGVLPPATALIAAGLIGDPKMIPGVVVYALGVSLMAACAWTSRFPRLRTGLGAVMFTASDLLIFARGGPLAGAAWIGLAIWGLYYAGQLMICLGVTDTLSAARRA